jgi:hypothetical protein
MDCMVLSFASIIKNTGAKRLFLIEIDTVSFVDKILSLAISMVCALHNMQLSIMPKIKRFIAIFFD